MWLKHPPEILGNSENANLNFLFQSDKFFIMDNHLAAGWCWLNILDINQTYNLFHIDRHYDLLDFPETMQSEIIDKGIELNKLSLTEYLNLKQPINSMPSCPMFRWDNYIGNLKFVYQKLFGECYFATHDDGNELDNFITYKAPFYELTNNIEYWIRKNSKNRWIVNLDIDYFFADNDSDKEYQVFTDDFIINICNSIKKALKHIDVVTISLSPEFCGGWEIAIQKAKIVADCFDIEFHVDAKITED